MKLLRSIDPAVVTLGWVGWLDDELVCAGLSIREKPAPLHVVCAEHARNVLAGWDVRRGEVVVEQMKLGGARDRGALAKANDLLDVQAVGAYVAGVVGSSFRYAPVNTWKGSAPKDVTQARAEKTLSATELAIVRVALQGVRAGLHHNLWDAVGVGLWATGRYALPGRGPFSRDAA